MLEAPKSTQPAQPLDRPGQAFFFVFAIGALSYALAMGDGHLHPVGIYLVMLTLGLAVIGTVLPTIPALARWDERATVVMLALALTWNFLNLMVNRAGIYLKPPTAWGQVFYITGLLLALLLAGAGLSKEPAFGRARMPLLLLTHFVLGCWLIDQSPKPIIDVDVIQRDAVKALLEGKNPYELTFPNIYGNLQFFGGNVATADRINVGFSYPPLSLLLAMPGQVFFGDYRYSQLTAMTISGALIAYSRPGRLAPSIAALLLFTPRIFFILEQGWTDPFLVMLIAAIVFFSLRRPGVVPWLFGLFIVVKQYAPISMLFSWLLVRPFSWQKFKEGTLKAAAIATVITLPFLLWNPSAFWLSVVSVNGQMPFRDDALSFAAWMGGPHPQRWTLMSVTALIAAIVIGSWRSPRTPSGFATALVMLYFGFFSFGGHAFCNHYYFIMGLLAIAAASRRLAPDEAPLPDDDPVLDFIKRRLGKGGGAPAPAVTAPAPTVVEAPKPPTA